MLWIIGVLKAGGWALLAVVVGVLAIARGYWWLRDELTAWRARGQPRELSEGYNAEQFQASEEVPSE